jgi:hypothetical protein
MNDYYNKIIFNNTKNEYGDYAGAYTDHLITHIPFGGKQYMYNQMNLFDPTLNYNLMNQYYNQFMIKQQLNQMTNSTAQSQDQLNSQPNAQPNTQPKINQLSSTNEFIIANPNDPGFVPNDPRFVPNDPRFVPNDPRFVDFNPNDPYALLLGAGSPTPQQSWKNYEILLQQRAQLDSEIGISKPILQDNTNKKICNTKSAINLPIINLTKKANSEPNTSFITTIQNIDEIIEVPISSQPSTECVASWPNLSIDNINASFKSVAKLSPGYKLKIFSDTNLVVDDSYFYMFRDESNGQSRNIIISFLDHLLKQTIINIHKLMNEIRVNNTSDNIATLTNMVHNMSSFIDNFNKIKIAYKNDNATCVRLDVIYNNFVSCYEMIFREMSIGSK